MLERHFEWRKNRFCCFGWFIFQLGFGGFEVGFHCLYWLAWKPLIRLVGWFSKPPMFENVNDPSHPFICTARLTDFTCPFCVRYTSADIYLWSCSVTLWFISSCLLVYLSADHKNIERQEEEDKKMVGVNFHNDRSLPWLPFFL